MPVKVVPDIGFGSVSYLAMAIDSARIQGADILANSWTFTDPYTAGVPALTEALSLAFQGGRGGLGCPITFSAGNGGDTVGVVNYPARLEQCFATGATDVNDIRYPYSSFGAELDIVAPSGPTGSAADVWTIDQMGELGGNSTKNPRGCPPGANDLDYNCKFNGTSAAQPLIAGTAALLLAKDSALTSSQVYEILRESAVTDLNWGTITPPDLQYGYGRVDAFRAVLSVSRGDLDNDCDSYDPLDLAFFIDYVFSGRAEPFPSVLLGDLDCDGETGPTDLAIVTDYLYNGGPKGPYPCFAY